MAGSITADRLKSFVERIEKLEEEQASVAGDKRDVYSEAKGVGYDVKTIRKIVQLRKMDAADRAEQETLLDTYKHALGMGDDDMEAQAQARAMKLAREVDRCLRFANDGQPPRIDAIMRELDCSAGKASKVRKMCEERIAVMGVSFSQTATARENEMKREPPHDPSTGEIEEEPDSLHAAAKAVMGDGNVTVEINAEPGSLLDRVGAALEQAAPVKVTRNALADARTFDEIAGPMPDFLRREASA